MSTNEEHLEQLRCLLCEASGCDARRASDFIVMSLFVRSRTHEIVGINTLKRLFRYGGEHSEPRSQTLNVLARSLGFRNYDDFCRHYGDDSSSSSDLVLGPHLASSSLTVGTRVRLRWNPGRMCLLEYLGNNAYRVLESQQSKLTAGDTFQASFFALGHAALLSNLIHADASFPLYEIGKQGGLTLAEVVRDEE